MSYAFVPCAASPSWMAFAVGNGALGGLQLEIRAQKEVIRAQFRELLERRPLLRGGIRE